MIEIVPLERKRIPLINPHEIRARVMFSNPVEVYARIEVDFFNRKNDIKTQDAFPQRHDGICSCGCGRKLPEYKIKWFERDCAEFSYMTCCVINGRVGDIKNLIGAYQNYSCKMCGLDMKLNMEERQLDHIIPVRAGGGGCWLNNYQMLCKNCHKIKTKQDHKLYSPVNPKAERKVTRKQAFLKRLRESEALEILTPSKQK